MVVGSEIPRGLCDFMREIIPSPDLFACERVRTAHIELANPLMSIFGDERCVPYLHSNSWCSGFLLCALFEYQIVSGPPFALPISWNPNKIQRLHSLSLEIRIQMNRNLWHALDRGGAEKLLGSNFTDKKSAKSVSAKLRANVRRPATNLEKLVL